MAWLALGVSIALVAAAAVYFLAGRGEADAREPIATLRTADFHTLAFRPDDANVVFFGHHDGLMRSDDGGWSWRRLIRQRHFDVMGMAVHPADPRQVYLPDQSEKILKESVE